MQLTSLIAVVLLMGAFSASAHDTWIEVDSPVVRTDDAGFAHLKLGNHGNSHRDFKLASKISREGWTLAVVPPAGDAIDLKPVIVDTGNSPKEGYWSAEFVPSRTGLHVVHHGLDKLHGKTRAVKSAKTYVLVSDQLDRLAENGADHRRPVGAPLELIALTDPVKEALAGRPLRVRLLYQGKPLPGARVTFVPRGVELKEGFDDEHERWTDIEGEAEYVPRKAGWVLVVVHHLEPEQQGEGYNQTHYGATLTFAIPRVPRGGAVHPAAR